MYRNKCLHRKKKLKKSMIKFRGKKQKFFIKDKKKQKRMEMTNMSKNADIMLSLKMRKMRRGINRITSSVNKLKKKMVYCAMRLKNSG